MIKWLFFDLGSTLIDESECVEKRFRETLSQKNAPPREVFLSRVDELARENREAYYIAVKDFALKPCGWDNSLEVLYPGVAGLLKELGERYSLGIIANQAAGTLQRLEAFGIRSFFDVIISSAEEGLQKPDKDIFLLALERAGCEARNAVMIGDRLDNDIKPAAELGFETVWVRQGYGALGNPLLLNNSPDYSVDSVTEIKNIFF